MYREEIKSRVCSAPLRILVVDDNEDGANSFSLLLRLHGNEVRMAYSGQEAILVAEEFSPHVIFMNVSMPGMDGFTATRRIKSQPWAKDITVFAVSGHGETRFKEAAWDAGCESYYLKPIDPEKIPQMLRHAKLMCGVES